jgi:hypothetical protein
MPKILGVLVTFLLLTGQPSAPAELMALTERVSITIQGEEVHLSELESVGLGHSLAKIVESCRLNSLESRNASWVGNPTAEWVRVREASHIYSRFITPIRNESWSGRQVPVSEAMIEIGESASLLGPVLSLDNDQPVKYIKCNGHLIIELQCKEPLALHLPRSFKTNCHLLQ